MKKIIINKNKPLVKVDLNIDKCINYYFDIKTKSLLASDYFKQTEKICNIKKHSNYFKLVGTFFFLPTYIGYIFNITKEITRWDTDIFNYNYKIALEKEGLGEFYEECGWLALEIKLDIPKKITKELLKTEISKFIRTIEIATELLIKSSTTEKADKLQEFTIELIEPEIKNDIIQEALDTIKSKLSGNSSINVKGLELSSINCKLSDIGGNNLLKEQINILIEQYQNKDFFEERGVKTPKGILLYGPPGTGKTLAAKVIAGSIGRKFYYVKASDVLSKWYGESTKIIDQIFNEVESPCVIFMDEIDSIASKRGRDGSHSADSQNLSILLQNIDGIHSDNKDIIVLGATNRKDELDSAILRAGRFDRQIFVGYPDREGRKEIIQIHFKKAIENSKIQLFNNYIDINKIVKHTENMTGADIGEIIRRTKEKAVYKSFKEGTEFYVDTNIVLTEINQYKEERSSEEFARNYKRIGFDLN